MKIENIETEYMDLLILILRGVNTSTRIAEKLKLPRKTVSNRLIHLERKGYIEKKILFNSRPYFLTSKGNQGTAIFLSTLKGCSKTPSAKLKAHKVTFSLKITRKPYDLIDSLEKNAFIPSKHRRWYKYRKQMDDTTIVFNPNVVYIYINTFFLESPMEYYDKAVAKVRKIARRLENRFPGLVLGTPDQQMVVESNHIVKQYGPLALKFFEESIRAGKPIVYHGSHLNVDFSDGPPEEETIDKRTAPQDMHNLGNFFNDWVQNPIQVGDLHQLKDTTNEIQVQQIDNTKEIKETREVTQHIFNSNMRLEKNLQDFMEGQRIFAKAMHEHVALIKTLQVLAQKNKEGLEGGMAIMAEGLKAVQSAQEEQMKGVMMQFGLIGKMFQEATTPWYKKLWTKIRELWRRNDGKI